MVKTHFKIKEHWIHDESHVAQSTQKNLSPTATNTFNIWLFFLIEATMHLLMQRNILSHYSLVFILFLCTVDARILCNHKKYTVITHGLITILLNLQMFCILCTYKSHVAHFSPLMLLLHEELPMRTAFLFSIERRDARRTDSCVILCRRPASEWRSFREHRTELRRELWAAPAIAILAAVRPGEGSGFTTSSADLRSAEEMLTMTSGEGILGGDWEVLRLSDLTSAVFTFSAEKRPADERPTSTLGEGGDPVVLHALSGSTSALFTVLFLSTSSSSTSSGFLFCTSSLSQLPRGEWLPSSNTSGLVCLFLRVVRLGCVAVLASEVEASGMDSSAMKFSDLTEEPRRLLRFPFENLDRKGKFI